MLHAIDDTLTMIGRSLRHARRAIDTLLLGVMLPVLLLLLFVYVFGGAIATGTEYINYVVPGVILLTAGYGAASTAVSVAADMVTGVIDRFRSLPILSSAVLTGHVAASLVRNLFSTVLVLGVATLMGFRPSASLGEWLVVAAVLVLFITALSLVSVCFGLIARSVEAASSFSFFILFLPYVSSAFVPVGTMPSWLRAFAEHQPVTAVIETVRGLLTGTPIGSSAWVALGWFGTILVVAYPVATVLFRRKVAR